MSKRARFVLAAALGALLAAMAPNGVCHAAQPLAEIMPAEVPLFIEVRDLAQLETEWDTTGFAAIYQHAAMQPFWQEVRAKRGGLLPNELLGCSWSDLKRAASQGAAYVMWPTKDTGIGTALVAHCKGNQDAARATLAAVAKQWQTGKARVQNIALGKVPVAEGQFPARDKQVPVMRYAFVHQDYLVLCDHREIAEELIARIDGAERPSLATLPAFARTMEIGSKGEFKAGALRWYVEPWLLWKGSLDADKSAEKTSLDDFEFYQRQGFGAISALGGAVQFGGPNSDVTYQACVVARLPLARAAGILTFRDSADFVPDGFIPGSATSVSVFHWDIVAAAAAYGFAYDEVYGEGYEGAFDELLDSIEKDADGPESNVRQDIIRRLASKVISASDYAGPKTPANPSGRRTLLACRTDDAAKTATAIERFFAGEKEIDVVVDHGVRVWQAKRSEARLVEADAEDPWSVNLDALCVAHGHFMVATDRTLLHEILQTTPSAKASRPYDAFFRSKPEAGKSCGRMYGNLEPAAEAGFELMRVGRLREAGWAGMVLDFLLFSERAEGAGDKIDGSLLPAYATVRGHLASDSMDVEPLADGWLIRGTVRNKAAR